MLTRQARLDHLGREGEIQMNEGMVGGDLSQEGKRMYLVREWAPTARASTRFHFESQDHADRGDDREYDLFPPAETTDPRHPLGKA